VQCYAFAVLAAFASSNTIRVTRETDAPLQIRGNYVERYAEQTHLVANLSLP